MLLVDYLVDFTQLNLAYTIMHANVINIRFFGGIKVALEPVCCKKRPKIVPDQLLVWVIRAL